jgi:hypothetical protein
MPCPTEDSQQAEHDGGLVITHITDPAQTCGGGDGRGRDDCIENDPIDAWTTNLFNAVCHEFGIGSESPAIPADFFGDGSDSFTGHVCLRGEPLGPISLPGYPPDLDFGQADTLVRRFPDPSRDPSRDASGDPFDRCNVPSPTPATVSTEVVALSLVSTSPITVTYNGGSDELWDVAVTLSEIPPPPGWIVAKKTHCNGGTYTSQLHVQPKFTFTKDSEPTVVKILDTGLASIPFVILTQIEASDAPWTSDLSPTMNWPSAICTDFHPAILDQEPTTDCDWNNNLIRDLCDIEDCPPGDNLCRDCNENELPDGRELAGNDCNGSEVLDECELEGNDCQPNGVPDDCDVDPSDPDGDGEVSQDCGGGEYENSIPDECEFDCDDDGMADTCAIDSGSSMDSNGNEIADDCEVSCCLPNNACTDNTDPQSCQQAGGVLSGPGSVCLGIEACELPDQSCEELDAQCCVMNGGAPQGPGSFCAVACGDCFPCDDDNACTKDLCDTGAGFCELRSQIIFGDANDNGVVNTADVLACNGAIPGGLCAMPTCDVNPICTGNGVLNTADVLTINGAIGQPDPCGCPPRNCP